MEILLLALCGSGRHLKLSDIPPSASGISTALTPVLWEEIHACLQLVLELITSNHLTSLHDTTKIGEKNMRLILEPETGRKVKA